jgi:D-glycero-alpha-D-manno-heptose-7-phosphate kinase
LVKKNIGFFEYKHKVVYRKIEVVSSLQEIEHYTARQCIELVDAELGIDYGIEVYHSGDLPARSGMGSSSAYAVGLLNALYALNGKYVSKEELAEKAISIEQLEETVGYQDQVACAYGGFNKIEFNTKGNFHVFPIPLSNGRLKTFQSHLMLFYLKLPRTASEIANSFVPDIDTKRRQLRIAKDLVEEGIMILCSDKNICLFGALLHEYWETKKTLSNKVSNDSIDNYYDIARKWGAIGGKILGAGGGGFLLIFAEPEKQEQIKLALKDLIYVPFHFEKSGTSIIFKG